MTEAFRTDGRIRWLDQGLAAVILSLIQVKGAIERMLFSDHVTYRVAVSIETERVSLYANQLYIYLQMHLQDHLLQAKSLTSLDLAYLLHTLAHMGIKWSDERSTTVPIYQA